MRTMLSLVVLMLLALPVLAGTVSCYGNGTSPPIEMLSTNALNFGDVDTTEVAVDYFSIYNIGGRNLLGRVWKAVDCDPDFSLVAGEQNYSIPPGDSLNVWVRFAPTTVQSNKQCNILTGAPPTP